MVLAANLTPALDDFDVCCDVTNVCRSPFAADYIVYLWIKQKGCFSLCLFNGKHWLRTQNKHFGTPEIAPF